MWSVSANILVMVSEDLTGISKSMPKSTEGMSLEHTGASEITEPRSRSLNQFSDLYPVARYIGRN